MNYVLATYYEELSLDEMWEILTDLGVSDETIQCMTSIHGYNEETLSDILWWKQGYDDFYSFCEDYLPERLIKVEKE